MEVEDIEEKLEEEMEEELENLIEEVIDAELEEEMEEEKRRVAAMRRSCRREPTPENKRTSRAWFAAHCPWREYFAGTPEEEEELFKEGSKMWDRFKLRFRLPPPLFYEVVRICVDRNIFKKRRLGKIPIEVKVLTCLRILARDNILDDLSELLTIGQSTISEMFHDFIEGFADPEIVDEYIKVPEGAQLREMQRQFERLGLPGCIGCIDGTHIYWDCCPYDYYNVMKGKEGRPSVNFQMVVDNERRLLSVSDNYFGTTHDATMLQSDSFSKSVIDGSLGREKRIIFRVAITK